MVDPVLHQTAKSIDEQVKLHCINSNLSLTYETRLHLVLTFHWWYRYPIITLFGLVVTEAVLNILKQSMLDSSSMYTE